MNRIFDRLADTVGSTRTLEDLARPMLEVLESTIGFDSVYVTTIDEEAGLQHVLFSRNARAMNIPEGLSVPWQDSLCRRALEQDAWESDDVQTRWPDSGAAAELGIRSWAGIPVTSGNRLYGTLCAASADAVKLGDDGRKLLGMFATVIGQQADREAMLAQLREANVELHSVALTDPLTGLGNRRAILAELARSLARAERSGGKVHVAFADLDGFKAINDVHGHDVGDAFLAAVASRLASALRAGDMAGRWGGDEFVVVACAPGDDAIPALRTRLESAFRGRYDLGEVALDYPGASIGIATAVPGEGCEALMVRADEAMYADKHRRRGG